jgi:hypothetical protein
VVLHKDAHLGHALHHRVQLVVQNSLAQGLNAALQRQNSKFHKLVAGYWLLVAG